MAASDLLQQIGLEPSAVRFGPGRRAAPLQVGPVRELSVEDLLAAQRNELVQKPFEIKALRQSHHQLARILAQGVSETEAAIITGYSASRISILKADPAFAELLQYYKDMEAQGYAVARADMRERLASLGFDAIETLHERLNDSPESFDAKTLLAILEATSDRTGHGKTSTVNQNVSIGLSAEALERVKSATLAEGRGVAVSEEDRRALVRLAASRTAQELSEGQPTEDWIEGEGHLVREASHSGTEPTVEGSSGD